MRTCLSPLLLVTLLALLSGYTVSGCNKNTPRSGSGPTKELECPPRSSVSSSCSGADCEVACSDGTKVTWEGAGLLLSNDQKLPS